MRIYSRQAFLTLPPGTVFCKGVPWAFGLLAVKGASVPNDFYARDLCWIASTSESDPFRRLEAMRDTGASVPLQTAEGRDGSYDEEEVFLVYEPSDLDALAVVLDAARAAWAHQEALVQT
jgi:hypothetical protein